MIFFIIEIACSAFRRWSRRIPLFLYINEVGRVLHSAPTAVCVRRLSMGDVQPPASGLRIARESVGSPDHRLQCADSRRVRQTDRLRRGEPSTQP